MAPEYSGTLKGQDVLEALSTTYSKAVVAVAPQMRYTFSVC